MHKFNHEGNVRTIGSLNGETHLVLQTKVRKVASPGGPVASARHMWRTRNPERAPKRGWHGPCLCCGNATICGIHTTKGNRSVAGTPRCGDPATGDAGTPRSGPEAGPRGRPPGW